MELLQGRTLADRLRDDGPLATDEALPLARQIAAGLQAAHDAGVVHGDLKAANVFLARDTHGVRAVLTDFGLATSLTGPTNREYSTGTLAYMAPEQLRGCPATTASDIYALGIVFYEMVSGVLPFGAFTRVAAAVTRVPARHQEMSRHLKNAPDAWRAAIAGCLALDPENRFGSAADAAALLIRGVPLTGRPAVRLATLLATMVVTVSCTGWFMGELKRTALTTVSSAAAVPASSVGQPVAPCLLHGAARR
jgi:serine/threonine-protein kinase